jgi:hypothetical protein
VLATSLAFAALHCWNPSLTALALGNIALAGVVFGLVYAVTGSLWGPIGLHAAWNFTMGGVAGLPVSGLAFPSLFATRVDGPAWITGGPFGPEGGIAVTCALAAGCAVWLLLLPAGARRALLRRP